MKRMGLTRSKAQKQLAKLEQEYQSLEGKGEHGKATLFWDQNLQNLSLDSNAATMQKLYQLMRDPSTILKGNRDKNAREYGTNLVQAAELWHKKMAPELWKILNNGVHDYISVLESGQTALGIEKSVINNIKEKLLVQNSKGQWELSKQDNYFPTQVLDLLPTFFETLLGVTVSLV